MIDKTHIQYTCLKHIFITLNNIVLTRRRRHRRPGLSCCRLRGKRGVLGVDSADLQVIHGGEGAAQGQEFVERA